MIMLKNMSNKEQARDTGQATDTDKVDDIIRIILPRGISLSTVESLTALLLLQRKAEVRTVELNRTLDALYAEQVWNIELIDRVDTGFTKCNQTLEAINNRLNRLEQTGVAPKDLTESIKGWIEESLEQKRAESQFMKELQDATKSFEEGYGRDPERY